MTRAVYSDGSFDVKLDDGAALQRRTADEWEPLLILRYEEGHDQRVVSMDQLRFLRPQFLDAASLSPPGPAPPPRAARRPPAAAPRRSRRRCNRQRKCRR